MAERKIDLMYRLFGRNINHMCEDCEHLLRYKYRGKSYRKCKVYGDTRSEASDWTVHQTACGQYNAPWFGGTVIRMVTPERKKEVEENIPLDGQLSLFEG